jgi:hypothetical protein
MESPKTSMLTASIIGAATGVYYNSFLNPLNNYFVFMAIFVIIGIGIANVVLLVLDVVYGWLKKYYADNEKPTSSPSSQAQNLPFS